MGTVAFRGGRKRQTQRKGPRRSPWLCTDTVNGSILARPCFLNAPRGVCRGLLAGGAEWLGLRAAIQVMPAQLGSQRGALYFLRRSVCLSVSEEPRAPAPAPHRGTGLSCLQEGHLLLTGQLRQFGCGLGQPGSGQSRHWVQEGTVPVLWGENAWTLKMGKGGGGGARGRGGGLEERGGGSGEECVQSEGHYQT